MAKLNYGSTPRRAPPVDVSQLGKARELSPGLVGAGSHRILGLSALARR